MSQTADKYALYGKAVQTPNDDARFLARYFKRVTGHPLRQLREDFCGTANILCEYVKLHGENRGIGIDLDSEPLEWCKERNLPRLSPSQRNRVTLLQNDVLKVKTPGAQMIVAMNFSYCVLKERKDLLAYFQNARRSLVRGGVFLVDNHGGTEVPVVDAETWHIAKGVKYTWDVSSFDPLTNHICSRIHFRFPDGSYIRNAFIYDWRLWSLPELRELFVDAGFQDVHVLWECTHRRSGYGNGVMRRIERGKLEGAWYAMVVGRA